MPSLTPAPFHTLPGDPAPKARAFWIRAEDGVRLRAAHWQSDHRLGTVIMLNGRTEYIEKYNAIALDLNEAGYDVLSLDWRGQGMSDRLIDNPHLSHIEDFADYQRDLVELIVTGEELDLPRPWHLLCHSMGGSIGYAALADGLAVNSAVFSAPMFGINFGPILAPLARSLAMSGPRFGQKFRPLPGSGGNTSFILRAPYLTNLLTTDGTRWGRLVAETVAWPELMLGGVTYQWLHAALQECKRQRSLPRPDLPVLIAVPTLDKIVTRRAIIERLEGWNDSELLVLDQSKHEPMIERPAIRRQFLNAAVQHFRATS